MHEKRNIERFLLDQGVDEETLSAIRCRMAEKIFGQQGREMLLPQHLPYVLGNALAAAYAAARRKRNQMQF